MGGFGVGWSHTLSGFSEDTVGAVLPPRGDLDGRPRVTKGNQGSPLPIVPSRPFRAIPAHGTGRRNRAHAESKPRG